MLGLSYYAKVVLFGVQGIFAILNSIIFFGIIGILAPIFAYYFGVRSSEDHTSNPFYANPEDIVLNENEVRDYTPTESEEALYRSAEYYLYKDINGLKTAGYKSFLSIAFLVVYNIYRADVIVAIISVVAIFAIHFAKILYLLVFVREYPTTFLFMKKNQ